MFYYRKDEEAVGRIMPYFGCRKNVKNVKNKQKTKGTDADCCEDDSDYCLNMTIKYEHTFRHCSSIPQAAMIYA